MWYMVQGRCIFLSEKDKKHDCYKRLYTVCLTTILLIS